MYLERKWMVTTEKHGNAYRAGNLYRMVLTSLYYMQVV